MLPRFNPNTLQQFTQKLFESISVPSDVARQAASTLLLANLSGHDSHGRYGFECRPVQSIDREARDEKTQAKCRTSSQEEKTTCGVDRLGANRLGSKHAAERHCGGSRESPCATNRSG